MIDIGHGGVYAEWCLSIPLLKLPWVGITIVPIKSTAIPAIDVERQSIVTIRNNVINAENSTYGHPAGVLYSGHVLPGFTVSLVTGS
jgi:hypothetical protein